ncbi:MAG: GntR family transcriptional regulator [Thermodesulfobacteriota bacterium]
MPSKGYLRDKISQQLARDITLGLIFPGEKLTEISLCERFKVSRTPVREALMLLEKQGFVEYSKNAGATVRKDTERKILELEDVYAVLEGRSLELIVLAGKIQEDDIDRLMTLQEKMEHHVAEGDIPRYMECNIEFHLSILKKCPNEELGKLLREMNERLRIYRRGRISPRPRDLQKLLEGHRRIIDAIRKSDAFQARRLLETHVREGLRTLSVKDVEKILTWR